MQKFNRIKYLSIPYVEGGRDFYGADCYGLVLLFIKNELNIKIKDNIFYDSVSDYVKIHEQTDSLDFKHKKIHNLKDLQFGDVIVFLVHGKFNSHVGICLGDKFFHTQKKTGPIIDNLYSHFWVNRFSFGIRLRDENNTSN